MRALHHTPHDDVPGWTDQGSHGHPALAAVVAAALLLRLWHIGWGLPDLYEEATPLFRAWGFWNWAGPGLDLNPHFFNYPALTFVVQFLLQALHFGVGFVTGLYPTASSFQAAWAADLSRFVVIGRLPGILCDVGTVAVTGLLAGELVNRRAGIVVAVMAAVNPLQIRLSQMIAVDSMLAFLCTLALLVMIRLARSGGTRRVLLAGLLVGLAASVKYTGAVLLVPLMVATAMGLRRDGSQSVAAMTTTVLSPVFVAGGVFLLLNPFILIDSASFARDFGFEQMHMAAGHFGIQAGESTPLFYLSDALPLAMGWPALAVALAGVLWVVRQRDRGWIIVALALTALIMPPMFWAMRADRYMLPALPLLMLLFAAGLEWFFPAPLRVPGSERHPTKRSHSGQGGAAPGPGKMQCAWRRAVPAATILMLGALVQPVVATARYHESLRQQDTRAAASAWIHSNLPARSAIVLTPAGVNLDSSYIQLPIPYLAIGLEGIAAMYDARWYTDMDLLVGSDFDKARYLQEPDRYASFLRFFYDSLETRWTTVWSAEPAATRQGPRIRLFAPPPGDPGSLFPVALTDRLETVKSPRMLTLFAANLSSVLDARGRSDRARQLRTTALEQILRRFPSESTASIGVLVSMASRPGHVRAIADSLAALH